MPNRLIKESICTSEKINCLSDFHFRMWAYLITYVDDYGRGDGRIAIIKGRCFPLRDDVTTQNIRDGLKILADAGCIILYQVKGEPFLCFPNWDRHQTVRNKKSKYPSPDDADAISDTVESNCNQLNSNESKCSRNPIQSYPYPNPYPNPNPNPMIDDEDAIRIQNEHDQVLDAAQNAGFKSSPSERARLLRLYEAYGLEKMLAGISECVYHSATSLAYLDAVLKGTGKKQKSDARDVHGYEQRDYADEQKKALERMMNDEEW